MQVIEETEKKYIEKDDFLKRHTDAMCVNESRLQHKNWHNIKYTIVGMILGIIFIKAEIVSWFRIQEMFRLQSFHMYGVIGTAVLIGIMSIQILKNTKIKTIYGENIVIQQKKFNKGQIIGGLIFGIGWGITGACPGPIFAQIGAGMGIGLVMLGSAILGTWLYGYLREYLPH
jgi:uncharacterized membrane protein YedE/YeeE